MSRHRSAKLWKTTSRTWKKEEDSGPGICEPAEGCSPACRRSWGNSWHLTESNTLRKRYKEKTNELQQIERVGYKGQRTEIYTVKTQCSGYWHAVYMPRVSAVQLVWNLCTMSLHYVLQFIVLSRLQYVSKQCVLRIVIGGIICCLQISWN